MAPEALAGSEKPLWSAWPGSYMIKRLAGKTLHPRNRHKRQAFKEVQKIWLGRFTSGAERSASDLLRVGDLLMLVFGWRRQRLHRRRRDEKRNRIAFHVLDGAEGRFLFGGCMTAQAIKAKAGIRIVYRRVFGFIARRLIRPIPAVISALLIFDHDGPGVQLRAFLGGRRKHFLDDHRAIGDLAFTVFMFEPVPNFRRGKDLHRVMSAERCAADEW